MTVARRRKAVKGSQSLQETGSMRGLCSRCATTRQLAMYFQVHSQAVHVVTPDQGATSAPKRWCVSVKRKRLKLTVDAVESTESGRSQICRYPASDGSFQKRDGAQESQSVALTAVGGPKEKKAN